MGMQVFERVRDADLHFPAVSEVSVRLNVVSEVSEVCRCVGV